MGAQQEAEDVMSRAKGRQGEKEMGSAQLVKQKLWQRPFGRTPGFGVQVSFDNGPQCV